MDRPAVLATAALLVGSAIAVDPWGWAPYGPLRWALISTVLLVMAAVVLRDPIELHLPSALGWLAFIVWGAVAGVTALDPLYTWIGTPDRHLGLLTIGLFAVAFFVGQSFTERGAVKILLQSAVIALGLIGVYTLLEVVDLAPVDLVTASGRPGGPYGSAAYLGAVCALLLPIVLGAAVDGLDSTRWRYFAAATAAVGVFAALASQTRAGWIGLLAAALISLPATAPWLRRHWQPVAAVAAALVVVAVVSPIGSRLASAFDFDDGTARGRLDEWQIGAAVAVNHPISGVGFEGYRIAFSEGVDAEYEQRYTRQTMPDRAHNGALDIAVTTGVPGLALYLAAAVFLLRQAMSAVRTRRPWLVGIAAGVAGYLAQQWFLFPLAEVDPVFWVFAGVLVAAGSPHRALRVRAPRWVGVVVMALAAIALTAGAFDVAADHRAAAAFNELVDGDLNSAVASVNRASELRPDSIRYHFLAAVVAAEADSTIGYSRAVFWLNQALDVSPGDPILRAEHASFLLRQAQSARDPALLAAATAEWEALVDDDPVHARYRLELGNAYAIAGSRQGAEIQWLIAADLAPRSIASLINLATLLIDSERADEAAAIIERARAIEPDSPEVAALEARLGS